eukprot:403352906
MQTLPQPIQTKIMGQPNINNNKERRIPDMLNYDYTQGLTPQEQSMKRNYDIKQLIKQTKLAVPKGLDPQTILAFRDKHNMESIHTKKLRSKQTMNFRPLSQGSLIIMQSNGMSQMNEYQTNSNQHPHTSSQMSSNLIGQNTLQNRISKNKADQLLSLKKGYALSQRAPSLILTKNSIYLEKMINLKTELLSTQENKEPQSPSQLSSMRLNTASVDQMREPKLYGKNGELQTVQQKQFTLQYDIEDLQHNMSPKGIYQVSIEDKIKSKTGSGGQTFKNQQTGSYSSQTKSAAFNTRKASNRQDTITPKNFEELYKITINNHSIKHLDDKINQINSTQDSQEDNHQFSQQNQDQFHTNQNELENLQNSNDQYYESDQVNVDNFIERAQKSGSIIDNQSEQMNVSLDKYLKSHRNSTNDGNYRIPTQPIKTQEKDKKFLSSNDELFMNIFQCTTLPSPPNIPINESLKFKNYSERERYYRIAGELMKIKKIIENDQQNTTYYTQTRYIGIADISAEQVDNFNNFLKQYELPPFLSGCTLKDFLVLIMENKLESTLFDQEMQQQQSPSHKKLQVNQRMNTLQDNLRNQKSIMSATSNLINNTNPIIDNNFYSTQQLGQTSPTSLNSVMLNSDKRNLFKMQKRSESQKSLQDKVDSYRKSINANFNKFKFQSANEDLKQLSPYKIDESLGQNYHSVQQFPDKQMYQTNSETTDIIKEASQRFGMPKKSNGHIFVMNALKNPKSNQRGGLLGLKTSYSSKRQLLFSIEKPLKMTDNLVNIESLMMKRIEEKEKTEKDLKSLNEEGYSSKWNSRKFFWRNNPQMKRSMSHLNFFSNQYKMQQLRTVN